MPHGDGCSARQTSTPPRATTGSPAFLEIARAKGPRLQDGRQRNPDGSLKLNNYNFPLLNYKSKATRKYLIDSMLHWIKRGADGFRCDVGYQIPLEFWEEATAACWKVKPGILMAEHGKLAADGTCSLGPWGYVVVDL